MSIKPILIVAGEPNSIFIEILIKSLVKKKFKSPIVLIVSTKIFLLQMQKLKINDIRMVENQMIDLDKKVNEVINLERNDQLNNYSNIYFNKVKKEIKINEN